MKLILTRYDEEFKLMAFFRQFTVFLQAENYNFNGVKKSRREWSDFCLTCDVVLPTKHDCVFS